MTMGGMDLLYLVARLALDKSQYKQGLEEASTEATTFGENLKNGLSAAAKITVGAISAVTTAAVSLTKTFIDGASEVAEYGDHIDKASQKLGISAEAYQEWDAVMQHSGTSIDSFSRGMMSIATAMDDVAAASKQEIDIHEVEKAKLAYESASLSVEDAQNAYNKAVKEHGASSLEARKAAQKLAEAQYKQTDAQNAYTAAMEGSAPALTGAAAAIQGLGVSVVDASGNMRAQEDVFADVITALQNIEDESQRTAAAQAIFGRGAMELGPLLNTSAEDTQAMRDRVHELGGVMSNEAVKAAAAYQDSLQDMQTAFRGLRYNLMAEFLPSITAVMNGITELMIGGDGIGQINAGIDAFVSQLSTVIPRMLEVGTQIVLSLAGAIVENLPVLLQAAVSTILTLATGIIEQLPMIVAAGLQVIQTLISSLTLAIPQLIPTAVQVVLQIATTIIETLPAILDSGVQLLLALVQGIINSIPQLVAALPQIISSITTFFTGAIPTIVQAGVDLLESLVQSMPTIINTIVQALPEIITNIVTFFTNSIPTIVETGVSLLSSLISNMPLIITNVLTAIPEIITSIITALIENIPLIVEAGVQLLVSLITNLPQIIAQLVAAMPQIIAGIVGALGQGVSDLAQVGVNLLSGLWGGISSKIEWLKSKVSGLANKVTGWFKGIFGIQSPSKVFAEIGRYLDEGLGEGIERNANAALDPLMDIADEINGIKLEPHYSGTYELETRAASGIAAFEPGTYGNTFGGVTININGAQNPEEIARQVERVFVRWQNQERVAFA